jgi:hypothetical protein
MFKIFRKNHIFGLFNNTYSTRFFSTQPQSKVSEVKFNKPENMSEAQEIKFYQDEFQKVYNDNRLRFYHLLL